MGFVTSECDDGYQIGTGNINQRGNGYTGTVPSVLTIPFVINGNRITEVGDSAFYACNNLEQIIVEEGVLRLGKSSFRALRFLKYAFLPSTLKILDQNAFDDCYSLETVHINQPSNLNYIGLAAFSTCKALKQLIIPDTTKTVGHAAFGEIDVSFTLFLCGKQKISVYETVLDGTKSFQIISPINGATKFGQYDVVHGSTPCIIKPHLTCINHFQMKLSLCPFILLIS